MAYVGSDAGDEQWGLFGSTKCYFKKSADGMGTWSAEQAYGVEGKEMESVSAGRTVGDAGGRVMPAWFNLADNDITVNVGNDVEIEAAAGGAEPEVLVSGHAAFGPNVIRLPGKVVAY